MIPFDLAVFDIAGTTVRDERFVGIALQTALSRHGHEVSLEALDLIMGMPKPVAIAKTLNLDTSDEVVADIHETFRAEMIRFYQEDSRVQPIEGAAQVFAFLRGHGLKVALDTGFDREITDSILRRLEWYEDVIDTSVTSDEVENGRPYPDLILAVMDQLGLEDSSRVMKIGDTVSDVREGRAAGCGLVISVLSGTDSRRVLELESPDLILDSVAELLTFDFSSLVVPATTLE